jgi:ribosomal protein L11 methyltransferase
MNRRVIWKIAVATNREGEDAVADLLETLFDARPCAYANTKTGRTTVAVYCDTKPATVVGLRAGLARTKTCGLEIGTGKVSVTRIRRENWAESWKRHFKPMAIGDALLIKPSWSRRKPRRGQSVIVLDPGLSFGTGHHATTSFCLHELVRRRRPGRQSFLDMGTGSGILAIVAVKLGYSPVHGFDFDPEAVRVAEENARTNGVASRLRIRRQDLTRLRARPALKYDMICANLISTLLAAERRRIVKLLKPGGVLVLAGILKSEFAEVEKAFKSLGLRRIGGKTEKEWRSGSLSRGAH